MNRPKGLDLFSGAGGSSMGYHLAGFEMTGVDIAPQPRFPFRFIQADALEYVAEHRHEYAFIAASPPCQAFTTMSNRWRGAGGRADSHADLIAATRERLLATGLPYVIENVPGARARLRDPLALHGGMFGLGVQRLRYFESNVLLLSAWAGPVVDPVGVYGKSPDGRLLWRRADGSEQRAAASLEEASEAMGVDWMGWRELAEAVPPAFTEYVGRQLMFALERVA